MALDVLIVDDSAAIRKILHRVLVQAEVPLGKVHEASDGNEALEKLKVEKVGLILSDINMPNMDGIQMIAAVRKLPANAFIPILMLTTESQAEKKDAGRKAGATGWIVKPFNTEQLLSTIQKLVK